MKKEYDLIIVGSGLYGCVTAYLAHQVGWRCLVIEKRSFVGGNIRDEVREGINVHLYGPHVFHTRYQEVWDFANLFTRFNHFRYCPLARYGGKMYNLPFNMHTFYQLYGTQTPEEAALRLRQEQGIYPHPRNLEEKAISMVGRTMYETLIKGYTEKQWGRSAVDLPAFIIQRLPVRFTFDNNYFDARYQGIPVGGYTLIIEKMLAKVDLLLEVDYLSDKAYLDTLADNIVYTGEIDRYFDYFYGTLEYRTLRFETTLLEGQANFQGNAVVNYTDADIQYTRIVEHKHFEFGCQPDTVITKEFPAIFEKGTAPYYPINNKENNRLYEKYYQLSQQQINVFFGGRLAEYKYYNMDQVVERALKMVALLES